MAAARRRLAVVENTTPGFFDPISMASEIHLTLKPAKNGLPRDVRSHLLAYGKARSSRVCRARKIVIDAVLADNPQLQESDLIRQTTKNHPVCLHASLLGKMRAELYPDGGVYILGDDAAWLAKRAPPLKTTSSRPASADGGSEQSTSTPPGPSGGGGAATRETRWWSNVARDDVSNDFTCPPPWDDNASERLVEFHLAGSTRVILDPSTGLVRATDVTVQFDRGINGWLSLGLSSNDNEGTRGFAYALASKLQTTPNKLVYVVPKKSVWAHVTLCMDLLCWCLPELKLEVIERGSRVYAEQHVDNTSNAAPNTSAHRLNRAKSRRPLDPTSSQCKTSAATQTETDADVPSFCQALDTSDDQARQRAINAALEAA